MSDSKELRIVVVDDSVVIRHFLRTTYNAQPDMHVVGAAADGLQAVSMVERLDPDLVVLDVEMPVMDGLAALDIIHTKRPRLPVVVFTSTDPRQAALGMSVLAMSYTKWLTKPSMSGAAATAEETREELVLAARQLTGSAARSGSIGNSPPLILPVNTMGARKMRGPFEVLVIGASTGGPDALAAIMSGLPADLCVPVVIVQHMPQNFTQHFADRLDACSQLHVLHGVAGEVIRAGAAYVAPGGIHTLIERQAGELRLQTNNADKVHGCRPAADLLFRSAVKACGSGVLATVLTGMGSDGLVGCATIRLAGGRVLIQDEATSVVWGMPGEVHRAGLADGTHPISEIASAITSSIASVSARSPRTSADSQD